ncbi:hypothetical protein B0T26DRAFT_813965 [Lasiosphaeria miniovina]|uniref:Uncharacterized protein n=1 Tax=Lasiosphaeria miniovina TaxID=1954250 RepID=A0AA40DPY6_9PEZI|nr:uncharacterized protein B0T26DRAFT_813965 [Lasiosphaeria miniovina]KAK0709146.1 hypothetical protein B0T26DRAFT_813965 [Lasiosphaeria miniovina]
MASPAFSRALAPQSHLLLLVRLAHAAVTARSNTITTTTKSTTTSAKAPPRQQPKASAATKPKKLTAPLLGGGPAGVVARRALPSYAEQLAAKERTIIYEAPSHAWFRGASFSTSAFCVAYAVYQYWTIYLHPPDDLAWWVPHAFGVVCMFMASMGGYFALGTARVVKQIDVVPFAPFLASTTATASKSKRLLQVSAALLRAAKQKAVPPVLIEVATRRPFPFLPAKRRLFLPDEVQLPFRMNGVLSSTPPPPPASFPGTGAGGKTATTAQAQRAERERRARARQYELDHIMTAPFRDASKGFHRVSEQMSRVFTGGGFARIDLRGARHKLDVTGGWALDNGRAMDRLLTIRSTK